MSQLTEILKIGRAYRGPRWSGSTCLTSSTSWGTSPGPWTSYCRRRTKTTTVCGPSQPKKWNIFVECLLMILLWMSKTPQQVYPASYGTWTLGWEALRSLLDHCTTSMSQGPAWLRHVTKCFKFVHWQNNFRFILLLVGQVGFEPVIRQPLKLSCLGNYVCHDQCDRNEGSRYLISDARMKLGRVEGAIREHLPRVA